MLDTHILPALGSERLRDFTPQLLSRFFREKQESGYNRKLKVGADSEGKPKFETKHFDLSSQTLAHIRNVISAVLRHARNCGMFVGQLPTECVSMPAIANQERQ